MKIHYITATEVRVPIRAGYVDSTIYGDAEWKHLSKWILELQFDHGIVGLGETPRGTTWAEVQSTAQFLAGKSWDAIRWQRFFDPVDPSNDLLAPASSKVAGRCWEHEFPRNGCYYGFEVALLDALGKQCGLPLSGLLGGAWRTTIPTSFRIGRMTPKDAPRFAVIGRKMGFISLKLEASIEDDLAGTITAIRDVLRDPFPIIVNPRGRFYRLVEALAAARKLDSFPDISYENPFPYHPEEWKEFRRETRRPLIWNTDDPWRAAQDRACDYLNLNPLSLWQTRFVAETAARFGMLHYQGTGIDLGILDAARLHSCAAARTCTLNGDAVGHRIREDDLILEELEVKNGEVRVPTSPGLGVTLDPEAVKRYKLRQEVIVPS